MPNPALQLKDHWKEQRLFLSRIIASAIVVVLLMGLLIARLVQLQIVDYQRFSELSQGNQIKIEPLPPTRGLIVDRNGLIIAENLPTWQLVVVPEQLDDVDAVLDKLRDLGLLSTVSHEELVQLIQSHRGFERVPISNLTEAEAARFAVRRHRFPGVDIQEGLVRYYPFGEVAAHAAGYVGSISADDFEMIDRSDYAATSQIGKVGIERSYESLLHGHVGYRQQVVNAQGRVLLDSASPGQSGAQGGLETRWPVPGSNVVLSLDMRLQLAGQEAMRGARGAVVAIDPRNGDLLALVSTPSFDPNQFAAGLSRADFVALNTDADKPLFNRALAGLYPPGSTVKPFFGLAALYYESVNPEAETLCPGYFRLPGSTHRYRDWKSQGHGDVDLHKAIVESCDVYFFKLATDLGIDHMHEFMTRFGFGELTGLDIGGERAGLMPSREWKRTRFQRREDQVWFPGETVITGIGQGFTQATPLQLAHAAATMAARGEQFRPRLLIGTEDPVTRTVEYEDPIRQPGLPDVDDANWQFIHDAMFGVTTELHGTGRTAMHGAQYTVAGKSGTAQVITVGQDEEYNEDEVDESLRDHSLFVAFAPFDNPEIAIAVVVENGGHGRTAAPITRQILDAYFKDREDYVARNR